MSVHCNLVPAVKKSNATGSCRKSACHRRCLGCWHRSTAYRNIYSQDCTVDLEGKGRASSKEKNIRRPNDALACKSIRIALEEWSTRGNRKVSSKGCNLRLLYLIAQKDFCHSIGKEEKATDVPKRCLKTSAPLGSVNRHYCTAINMYMTAERRQTEKVDFIHSSNAQIEDCRR